MGPQVADRRRHVAAGRRPGRGRPRRRASRPGPSPRSCSAPAPRWSTRPCSPPSATSPTRPGGPASVGIYRLWRDGGFAVGALLAGVVADALGVRAAVWTVAALTAASGSGRRGADVRDAPPTAVPGSRHGRCGGCPPWVTASPRTRSTPSSPPSARSWAAPNASSCSTCSPRARAASRIWPPPPDLGMSTCSAHLQTLREAGLVGTRREGKRIYYSLAGDDVAGLWDHLRRVAQRHRPHTELARRAYLGPDDTDRRRHRRAAAPPRRRRHRGPRRAPRPRVRRRPPPRRPPHPARGAGRAARRAAAATAEIVAYCRGRYCVLAHDAVRLLDAATVCSARRAADGHARMAGRRSAGRGWRCLSPAAAVAVEAGGPAGASDEGPADLTGIPPRVLPLPTIQIPPWVSLKVEAMPWQDVLMAEASPDSATNLRKGSLSVTAQPTIIPIDTPTLGDRSYLVHDGEVAFVVDPQRDIDRVLDLLERARRAAHPRVRDPHPQRLRHRRPGPGRGAPARRTSSTPPTRSPSSGPRSATATSSRSGHGCGVTALSRPRATPSPTCPTPSSDADGGEQVAVFTGGSLLYGSTGRPDLLGARAHRRPGPPPARLGPPAAPSCCRTRPRSSRPTASAASARPPSPRRPTSTIGAGEAVQPGADPGRGDLRRRAARRPRRLPRLLRAHGPGQRRRPRRRPTCPRPRRPTRPSCAAGSRPASGSSTCATAPRSPPATCPARSTSASTAASRPTSAG